MGDEYSAKDLNELRYTAKTKHDYILCVEREDAMIDRIANFKPEIVIVGQAHGDYFVGDGKQVLAEKGITVKDYAIEGTGRGSTISYAEVMFGPRQSTDIAHIDRSASPNPRRNIERQNFTRRYNAVTTGRINPESNPQFIGTWDTYCRPHGLFEVHQTGEGFAGLIEDGFGLAKFKGEIDSRSLQFVKYYDPELSARIDDADDEVIYYVPIIHEATSTDGVNYHGEYSGEKTGIGKFILVRR